MGIGAVLFWTATAVALPPIADAKGEAGIGPVTHVSDGDTIVVRLGSRDERIRLLGIDAPESSQEPWGPRAARYLESLVGGKTVRVGTDVQTRDRYGRMLGYVYVGNTFVNLELVRQGYAMLYTSPPNVAHSEAFLAAQRQARDAGRNIWSPTDGLTETPYEYRHNKPAPRGIGQGELPNGRRHRGRGASIAPGNSSGAVPTADTLRVEDRSPIIANRRSRKFHTATCPLAEKIAEANRQGYESREAALAAGLVACRSCKGAAR